jgi:hypothetical protein
VGAKPNDDGKSKSFGSFATACLARKFPDSMIQLQSDPDGPGRPPPYISLAMTASACASLVVSVFPLCALNWLI